MLLPFKAACVADLLIDLIGLSILICQMKSSSVLNCADVTKESTKGTQWQFTREVILFFCDTLDYPRFDIEAQGCRDLLKNGYTVFWKGGT